MRKIIKMLLALILGERRIVMRMRRGLFKGVKLRIRPKNQLSLVFCDIEPELQNSLVQFITSGDVVFDVGANVGYVSVAMSRLVGVEGRVFAFEPIPETASECASTLKMNNCENVTLIRKALSDEEALVEFRIPDVGSTDAMASMMWHKNSVNTKKIQAQTCVLDSDELLSSLNPSFIKIDVEGAEGKAIVGMQSLIKSNKPVIFIECSEIGRATVWHLLKSFGYSCFLANDLTKQITDFDVYTHDNFVWVPE